MREDDLDKQYRDYKTSKPIPLLSLEGWLKHKIITMGSEYRTRRFVGVIYQNRFYLYHEVINAPWIKEAQPVYF